MKLKKVATAAGVAAVGVVLVVSTQGSAQAAPAKPVSAPVAATTGSQPAPFAIGGLVNAAKGAYHVGRAVGKGAWQVAKGTTDNMVSHGTVIGFSSNLPKGASTDTLFDK